MFKNELNEFQQRHYFSIKENCLVALFSYEQYLGYLKLDIEHIEGLLIFSDEALKIHLFDDDNYIPSIISREHLEKALKVRKKLKRNTLRDIKNGK